MMGYFRAIAIIKLIKLEPHFIIKNIIENSIGKLDCLVVKFSCLSILKIHCLRLLKSLLEVL